MKVLEALTPREGTSPVSTTAAATKLVATLNARNEVLREQNRVLRDQNAALGDANEELRKQVGSAGRASEDASKDPQLALYKLQEAGAVMREELLSRHAVPHETAHQDAREAQPARVALGEASQEVSPQLGSCPRDDEIARLNSELERTQALVLEHRADLLACHELLGELDEACM